MKQIPETDYDQKDYLLDATPVEATAVLEATPVAHSALACALPLAASGASVAVISEDDDAKAKYEAEEAEAGTFIQKATCLQDYAKLLPAPYSTDYDPELERRIAEEATRRGRQLAKEEIQQMRQLNRMAEAIGNEEKMSAERAHLNALYQNYQEEITGTTQTSATIPKEAYGVPMATAVSKDGESDLYPDSFGKEYDTATYETAEYQMSEYKSVYDP
jgi:hypothetical protein